MRTFNPIEREYVAPADLSVLSNTYNTLEQGHKEAVATASELKTAMANLDLNEAEDEWRQQRIADIQTTIQQNTLHGNSYAALDDIIAKAGDLSSDAGMLGRLRAQQDFKAYKDNLDNRTDITEETKEYFREVNQYNYEDKLDKDGNVIGGSKWNPTEREVSTVNLADIVNKGISLAAKESGGSNQTRWLDANGNITTDYTQAFDGEVFNDSTNQWERLTRDKIEAGITAMIEMTPGAKASLEQDYKVANWKYKKNGDYNPDVTDQNGFPLSFNDYVNKRIDPAIEAAKYHNVTNRTTYGKGGATYGAAMRAVTMRGSGDLEPDYIKDNPYSAEGTPITVAYDQLGKVTMSKQNANNDAFNILKTITGKDVDVDFNKVTADDWKAMYDEAIAGKSEAELNTPEMTRLSLDFNRAIRQQRESLDEYNSLVEGVTDKERNELDFTSRMNSGAGFDPENPIDAEFITMAKNMFTDDTQKIRVSFKDVSKFDTMISVLSGGDKEGYKTLGYTTGTDSKGRRYVELDRDHYNQSYLLSQAVTSTLGNRGPIATAFNIGGITADRIDSNGNVIDVVTKNVNGRNIEEYSSPALLIASMQGMVMKYDRVNNNVQKTLKGRVASEHTYSNPLLSMPVPAMMEIQEAYDRKDGTMDAAEYKDRMSREDDKIRNMLATGTQVMTDVFTVDSKDGSGTMKRVVDSKERLKITQLVKNTANTKQMSIAAANSPTEGLGLYVTVHPKLDKDGNPSGESTDYFLPGYLNDAASERFKNSPTTIASNKIDRGNQTKQTYVFTESTVDPSMGTQTIKCLGDNNYIYNDGLESHDLNREQAINVAKGLTYYNQMQDYYKSRELFNKARSEEDIYRLQEGAFNKIKEYAEDIANNIGKPNQAGRIYSNMIDDLIN